MYLKELELRNFRVYLQKKLKFSPGINVILGANAVGKTSLIEAIHFLGLCKSHKTNAHEEVITYDQDNGAVFGTFNNSGRINKVVVGLTKSSKKIIVNGKPIKSMSEYIGFISMVIFAPDDLGLISGAPSQRRKFLDVSLSQIDKSYLHNLINYRRILKERNELLKNFRAKNNDDLELLKVISEQLAVQGEQIIEKRRIFIEKLNNFASDKINYISLEDNKYILEYQPSIEAKIFRKELLKKMVTDILYKTTTIGPHRDNFVITNQGKDVALYGSQGQQRTVVLGLKLGLADMLDKMDKKLIILLDDVFSELDFNRQNRLIASLKNANQIFITATSIDGIDKELVSNSNIIEIRKE